MTTARIAIDTVYQSSRPTWPRTLKFVKNAIEKLPSAFSGTPRATLPAAAPKRIASKKLEQTKMKSQYVCQRRSLMCPPTFERDTAQNQTPQNQKEGEIVTGKSRSHHA